MAPLVNEKAWLTSDYAAVKSQVQANYASAGSSKAIANFASHSLDFLSESADKIDLISKVAGKQYFTYARGQVMARPANDRFFVSDTQEFLDLYARWLNDDFDDEGDFGRFSYTAALAPCLAMELFD